MASIVLTTTSAQDTILARLLIAQNAERAAKNPPDPPYADVTAMVRGILIAAVQSWRAQQNDEDLRTVGSAYVAAAPATQATVRSTLGL